MDPAHIAVVIEVDGLPPLKNEALSLFNPGHTQVAKVRALLEAVPRHERAYLGQEPPDVPFHTGVSMSVTLWGPNDPPGDATNYLGGIGDTLQKQGKDRFTEELGHLASVAVIIDDKQIVEVHYRQARAPQWHYRVVVAEVP